MTQKNDGCLNIGNISGIVMIFTSRVVQVRGNDMYSCINLIYSSQLPDGIP